MSDRTPLGADDTPPRLVVFSGEDRRDVLAAVDAGRTGGTGPARLVVVDDGHADRSAAARRWLAEGGVKPPRVHYRDHPVDGGIAFVYTNGSAADPGGGVLDRIRAATELAVAHTRTSTSLGLGPQAAIGYSSGETTALIALGAWPDAERLYRDARDSGLFTHDLTGELRAVRRAWAALGVPGESWATYLVTLPADRVRDALAGERAVHLMAVNAPDVCVIGGEARACADVVRGLGPANTVRVDYDLAAHAPELAEVRDRWRALHLRPTTPVPGVRFYSGATTDWYEATAEAAADAVTAQALGTVDFAGTVERAWADGVRVFVEHGPRALCTGWAKRVLAGREHVAVAWDAGAGGAVDRARDAVAELVAAGVRVRAEHLFGGGIATRPGIDPRVVLPPAPELPPVVLSAGRARSAQGQAVLAEHHARLVATHRDVLAAHVESHQAFLAVRQAQVTALRQVAPALIPVAARQAPTRPSFDRAQLERLATGPISDVLGPRFAAPAGRAVRTSLPAPPMLILDRVLDLDAEPAALVTPSARPSGTISTETDVRLDGWYLDPAGRMPAGLAVEVVQSIALLAGWLGADLRVDGDRVFRLLGLEVTHHGEAPRAGETLRHHVTVDRFVEHDGVLLFSFRCDGSVGGEPRLTIRNGQAGFFSRAELDAAGGVRWSPADLEPADDHRPGPPQGRRGFTAEQVRAFADGRPADCFGPDWAWTRSHVRTPRVEGGRALMLHEVVDLDPAGGPLGRGYLKARASISPDDWYFAGHFPGDPCMPASLMLQGGFQAIAFHLAGLGFTVRRDGWRFAPVTDLATTVRCRGQATPRNAEIVYEVFVRAVRAQPVPTVHADLLVTVDGIKALHAADVGVRLVPDWPLDHWRHLGPPRVQTTGRPVPLEQLGGLVGHRERVAVATVNGVALDHAAVLACAWGNPGAVNSLAGDVDGTAHLARLPGPPFLFISRVVAVQGGLGSMAAGASVVVEYDVPDEVWYFEQNDHPVMPLAVLMEVALQPCGWLAGFTTGVHNVGLRYRNLDGAGTVTGEIGPDTRTVRTHVELVSLFRLGGVIMTGFTVRCLADGVPVFTTDPVFGFFPDAAFDDQRGLPVTDADRRRVEAPGDHAVDLTVDAPRGMPGPMLLMPDRITDHRPTGGAAGLGALRAEIDVDPGAWYFKAHFFTDPVQPGSLGVEAMAQLLRYHLIRGGADLPPGTRFEPVLPGREVKWKYRGQVTPDSRLVTVEVEVREAGEDERGRYVVGDASLWCDGLRIYEVTGLGVRAVAGDRPEVVDQVLDPEVDTWVRAHTPTWTTPVLPLASVLDRLAAAAAVRTGREVVGVRDLLVHRWIAVPGPLRLRTEATPGPDGVSTRLLLARDGGFDEVARAVVLVDEAPARPEPLALPADLELQPDIYESAHQFHGPEFHYITAWWVGANGARALLDIGRGRVPRGQLHQGVLDAALQAVPSFMLSRWTPAAAGKVAIPRRVVELDLCDPVPDSGTAEVRIRWAGFDGGNESCPVFDVQLLVEGRVAVRMRQASVLVPAGRYERCTPRRVRDFALRRSVEPLGPARSEGDRTVLTAGELALWEGLPGTAARVFDLPTGRVRDHLALLAVKEHVGRLVAVHPSAVAVSADLRTATVPGDPRAHRVEVTRAGGVVTVRSAGGAS
ncbi:3-hydroxymyristoyl/3-hydroxydecanoyl-(acyl carrier protein) dehydratase [Saccharothrix tamanrassetensis]|uniref:3-hydroxymyristoyl/3-hydroxydecanoyl-(Acyl carrier protein) dehydratase n=1 Tax=Saccharothrix tamanrassetensis TaxID=1051531 RepID=A0A841CMV3_9PSEU|nr:acyltransferase domain-containing protein [Saccharothrix tamanrassetensis]MBB5957325.1 3-hydroxymyristoyl/3-hydroxydecanoyl-(acyl carrier protein) dehydratase [Saccharothrix tamanrassetensis]